MATVTKRRNADGALSYRLQVRVKRDGKITFSQAKAFSRALHRTSLAKYAVAFFRISFSRLSRKFSARSRNRSLSSGETSLLPAPLTAKLSGWP